MIMYDSEQGALRPGCEYKASTVTVGGGGGCSVHCTLRTDTVELVSGNTPRTVAHCVHEHVQMYQPGTKY